ncbi:glycosyltransferase family 1 protein [Erythrobacteraceae bacterium CFH 75059]|uniref:glycosyltransferase family 4 protein n=1 Tax=Qipengyuania thermophila TaxID=2509361 RepID=UPI00101FD8BA|nr:glycosyltransferase family 4 protein [Qipengyuania thermophila]TCD05261.1 glycosyltransferase family 1 protein [Erythrobacteraceae bacterium CFH 75059]
MTADAVGGVWRYALELATAMKPLGWHTVLAIIGPVPDSAAAEAAAAFAGIDLRLTDRPLDWLARTSDEVTHTATALASLAADCGADAILCNSPALAGCARWPAPVIAVAHGCVTTWWAAVRQQPLPPEWQWHHRQMRRGLLQADAVVAPSHAFALALQAAYALPALPQVVHNGLAGARTRDVEASGVQVVTIGRLWDEAKGAAVLDRAAGEAGARLTAIGALDGPGGEHFRPRHLRPAGVLSNTEVQARLRARPVFVSAASFEPFGLAVLEAAMAGCPLILSDIPTFRELWDEAALFVASDDAAGFARAIDLLAGRPDLRRHWGEAAAERSGRYTPERCASGMQAVIGRAVASRAAA